MPDVVQQCGHDLVMGGIILLGQIACLECVLQFADPFAVGQMAPFTE